MGLKLAVRRQLTAVMKIAPAADGSGAKESRGIRISADLRRSDDPVERRHQAQRALALIAEVQRQRRSSQTITGTLT